MFYETDPSTGKRSWEAQGIFSATDVHRQVQFIRNNSNLSHIYFGPRDFAEKCHLKLDKPFPSPYLTKIMKQNCPKALFTFQVKHDAGFLPKVKLCAYSL